MSEAPMEVPRRHLGLVFVHGAGKEPSGYYRGFLAALATALGAEPSYLAAWRADLCDLGPAVKAGPAAAPRLTREAEEFRQAYLLALGMGVDGQHERGAQSPVRSVGGTLISLTDTVNDVVQYFYNPSMRSAIQLRLHERLAEAAGAFDHTLLVSHSLGTVIAYDVLRQKASDYNIHTWFTTGSPLAKLAQLGQVTKDVGQIARGGISAWHNLFDPGDVVASALSTCFAFPLKDVIVENGAGILNSHNYWGNSAVAGLVAEAVKRRYLRLPL
ncbi:MAG: hypothetical protein Q7U96_03400 [Chloroflexota bacterium]|nr:hypothetical protein [Chloroflexota bacterium]